jgi:hypothetical protein
MLEQQSVHLVCEACGEPGTARVRTAQHPRDVTLICGCGHPNVVACGAAGPLLTPEPLPDAPPVNLDDWKAARRRAIGLPGGRPPERHHDHDWAA